MARFGKNIGLVIATSFILSGCGIISLGSSTTNEKHEPDKERIAILTGESNLTVDPTMAGIPVVLPAPYTNDAWAQPGGNAENAVYHLNVGDTLSRAWSTTIGTGQQKYERFGGSPISADGMIFVMDTKATVSAVSVSGGSSRWSKSLENEDEKSKVAFGGGLSYADGVVYATTGYGTLIALDAQNGSELWSFDGKVPFRNGPTIVGDTIYANTLDNRLVSIDRTTGSENWTQIGISENAGIYGGSSPVSDGSVVITAFSSGEITAFRPANGLSLWADSLSRTSRLTPLATLADIDGHPVIDRGRVYAVSHAGSIVAIDLRTGQRAWEGNVASTKTPWVAGNFGFVVTVDAEVAAISLIDGRVRWSSKLQKFGQQEKRKDLVSWTAPILAGDRLFVASTHGYLVSMSPYTGEVLSAVKLPAGVTVDPIVVDNTLILVTVEGEMLAYR